MSAPKQRPSYDPEAVRDISASIYKMRLGSEDTRRMIERDEDDGTKLRERAASYDSLTRCYLDLLNERGLIQRSSPTVKRSERQA